MDVKIGTKQMMRAVHLLMEDDKNYNTRLMEELTPEEFEKFLEECPEFLDDIQEQMQRSAHTADEL